MKRSLLSAFSLFLIALFTFVGCDQQVSDSSSSAKATILSKQEVAIMASQISSELSLSKSVSSSITSTMLTNADKQPGFLWTTAKTMQSTLTAAQKDSLLNPAVDPTGTHPMHVPHGFGVAGGKGGSAHVPFDLLTDAQKTQVQAIQTKYRDQIKAIMDNTALTSADKATKVAALRAAENTEIMALLTDEQKAELAQRIADAQAQHDEALAADKKVRDEVLALTTDQSTKLDAIFTKRKDATQALLDKVAAGTLTTDALVTELQKVKDTYTADLKALLSATQVEIVLIHDALQHRKPRGMAFEGGKHGGPMGGGKH